jgi:glycosyltransferase involved in cell wall biosynthesis
MDISILICTRNRVQSLHETLQAMRAIKVPVGHTAELLVINNASDDDTPNVLARWQDEDVSTPYVRRALHEAAAGLSHARNAGLSAARGEIIIFTDDDVRPPVDWIEGMSNPIVLGQADAVTGGVRLAPHLQRAWMTPLQRSWLSSTENDEPVGEPGRMVGASMAFTRRVLDKVPGFDTALGAGALGFCEDILFSLQIKAAGFRIADATGTVIEHHFDPDRLSRRALLNRAAAEGRSTAYFWYHWLHHSVPVPQIKALLFQTQLAAWRRKKSRAYLQEDHEGCDEREMILESKLACYQQYLQERKRPRLYEKRGLKKITA